MKGVLRVAVLAAQRTTGQADEDRGQAAEARLALEGMEDLVDDQGARKQICARQSHGQRISVSTAC
jgi:hypothetical protein